jgi:hypothetical protein
VISPRRRRLERGGCSENSGLLPAAADDLEAYG